MRTKKTHCVRGHERTPENLKKGGQCRVCHREYHRKLRQTQEYKDQFNAYMKRRRASGRSDRYVQIKYKYGMTPEEFEKLLSEQSECCRICQEALDIRDKNHIPHVDHDHETKEVRALLCNKCNTGLGSFRDREDLLLKAAEYLKKYEGN